MKSGYKKSFQILGKGSISTDENRSVLSSGDFTRIIRFEGSDLKKKSEGL